MFYKIIKKNVELKLKDTKDYISMSFRQDIRLQQYSNRFKNVKKNSSKTKSTNFGYSVKFSRAEIAFTACSLYLYIDHSTPISSASFSSGFSGFEHPWSAHIRFNEPPLTRFEQLRVFVCPLEAAAISRSRNYEWNGHLRVIIAAFSF